MQLVNKGGMKISPPEIQKENIENSVI